MAPARAKPGFDGASGLSPPPCGEGWGGVFEAFNTRSPSRDRYRRVPNKEEVVLPSPVISSDHTPLAGMPERSTLRGAVISFQVDSALETAVTGSRLTNSP